MRYQAIFASLVLACLLAETSVDAHESLLVPEEDVAGRPDLAIRWQSKTVVLIQRGAAYGRMARLSDNVILCAYSRRGTIYVRRSKDDGQTWENEGAAVEYSKGHATNPELLVLRSGHLLLMYNERPRDGHSPYAIAICTSDDGGGTWHGHRRIYRAGTEFDNGCWEPAVFPMNSS